MSDVNLCAHRGRLPPMKGWDLMLDLRAPSPTPLFVPIARALEEDIRRGRLPPGAPLPGSRTLAESLGVHRNTVLAAYRELETQGWIVTSAARATYVSPTLPDVPAGRGARGAVPPPPRPGGRPPRRPARPLGPPRPGLPPGAEAGGQETARLRRCPWPPAPARRARRHALFRARARRWRGRSAHHPGQPGGVGSGGAHPGAGRGAGGGVGDGVPSRRACVPARRGPPRAPPGGRGGPASGCARGPFPAYAGARGVPHPPSPLPHHRDALPGTATRAAGLGPRAPRGPHRGRLRSRIPLRGPPRPAARERGPGRAGAVRGHAVQGAGPEPPPGIPGRAAPLPGAGAGSARGGGPAGGYRVGGRRGRVAGGRGGAASRAQDAWHLPGPARCLGRSAGEDTGGRALRFASRRGNGPVGTLCAGSGRGRLGPGGARGGRGLQCGECLQLRQSPRSRRAARLRRPEGVRAHRGGAPHGARAPGALSGPTSLKVSPGEAGAPDALQPMFTGASYGQVMLATVLQLAYPLLLPKLACVPPAQAFMPFGTPVYAACAPSRMPSYARPSGMMYSVDHDCSVLRKRLGGFPTMRRGQGWGLSRASWRAHPVGPGGHAKVGSIALLST